MTSHLFTPVFMFIHLKLILLVYWLTSKIVGINSYFCILLCITTHLLLFLSPDWLIFCHVIISLIYIHSNIYLFSVSLWRRANVRNIRLYYPYWSYWQYTNLFIYFEKYKRLISHRWLVHAAFSFINVVYCEGSGEIQIEISKVGELSLTKDLCSKR